MHSVSPSLRVLSTPIIPNLEQKMTLPELVLGTVWNLPPSTIRAILDTVESTQYNF